MPRTKRGGKRGNYGGGVARSGRRNQDTSFVPFSGAGTPRRDHNGFTLQDEARNTERHQSFWNTDQRLRDTQVTFVSAGTLDSTKPEEAEDALAEMTLDSPDDANRIEVFEEEDDDEEDKAAREEDIAFDRETLQTQHNSALEVSNFDYVIDVHGRKPIQTGLPQPKLRSVSPVPSNSSEEVILFGGRDRQGKGISRVSDFPRIVTDPIEQKIRKVEDEIHKQEELLQEVLRRKTTSSPTSIPVDTPQVRSRHQPRGRRTRTHPEDSEADALMADYIANIDKDDELHNSFARRDLGGAEDEIWQDTEASSGEPVKKTQSMFQDGWDRDEICDFDDLSTSDGVMGDVQQIFSKRDRASGAQYLVVWQDQTMSEARWVPTTTLTSVNALAHIETFEAEEKLVAEFVEEGEEDSSDSDEVDIDDDIDTDDEDMDNENLLQRKIDAMSDENIARLLAKQEELGMGSSQLMLFDDDGDDVPTFSTTFNTVLLTSKKATGRSRGLKRPKGEFPSATMMADAYDGFDVVDCDRPSLKKKPKGRKGKLILDVSDSELEASMEMAWENDRLKKKERKQEREELRAQGLLGSKNGKPDLKQKYKEGMGIHAVREEIKQFLMGKNTTLSLPPMDKADRKVIHEIANAFNLKSKSAGNGNTRFPILYKTSRTSIFAEHTYNMVEAKLTRRYLPRMDANSKKIGKKGVARGGGFNSAAVSYRDGDIVGGSAPELGAENKGRAMLEKMGWSKGTALGALNNKGILQPVSHVVKTTKAGLG